VPLGAETADQRMKLMIEFVTAGTPTEGDAEEMGWNGKIELPAVDFGAAPINLTTWNLRLPKDYDYRSDDAEYEFARRDQVYVEWGMLTAPRFSRERTGDFTAAATRTAGITPLEFGYVSNEGRQFLRVLLFIGVLVLCLLVPTVIRIIDPYALAIAVAIIGLLLFSNEDVSDFARTAVLAAGIALVVLIVRSFLLAHKERPRVNVIQRTAEPGDDDDDNDDDDTAATQQGGNNNEEGR
jgi:hypothetical protein